MSIFFSVLAIILVVAILWLAIYFDKVKSNKSLKKKHLKMHPLSKERLEEIKKKEKKAKKKMYSYRIKYKTWDLDYTTYIGTDCVRATKEDIAIEIFKIKRRLSGETIGYHYEILEVYKEK